MHWNLLRCIDTNVHLVASDGQYSHLDVISDAAILNDRSILLCVVRDYV